MYQFDSFVSLYLKLMSIFPLVFRDGKKYCLCNEYGPYVCCPLCSIRFYFLNFKEDLKENRMNSKYLVEYRDNLFPYLIACYVRKESSISCFDGHFFKVYDSEGNIHHDIWMHDFGDML